MNLSQMLMKEVKPLSAHSADRAKEYEKRKRARNPKPGSGPDCQRQSTLNNYKANWPEGAWLSTQEIERRVGRKRGGVRNTLNKWEACGLLEHRVVRNSQGRLNSFEWRWK